MGNYKNEQKVFEQYLLCQDLKRVCTTSSTTSFSNYHPFAEKGKNIEGISTAQRIFATQMYAIGVPHHELYGTKINLGRVLALLLLGGILESEELCSDITDTIVDNVFLEADWKWGNDLFEEYLAGKSPEAVYAQKCMDTERFWSGRPVVHQTDKAWLLSQISPYFLFDVLGGAIKKPRAGWLVWNMDGDVDVDAIADHTVMTQLLMIIEKKVHGYTDVDIDRALLMATLHDLVAARDGDVPISKGPNGLPSLADKKGSFHGLMLHMSWASVAIKRLEAIYDELQSGKSLDAGFMIHTGRCETSLQAKIYDEFGRFNPDEVKKVKGTVLQTYLDAGFRLSEAWIMYDQKTIDYDENFMRLTDYVRDLMIKPQ